MIMSVPRIGDLVQHREDKRIGRVLHVAAIGQRLPVHLVFPLCDGDVVVDLGHDRYRVCSGDYFWTRWENVNIEKLAHAAFDCAIGAESDDASQEEKL